MSVKLNKGAVKFPSIKAAYESARKINPNLKYMTFYMRVRAGKPVSKAYHGKVRQYNKAA